MHAGYMWIKWTFFTFIVTRGYGKNKIHQYDTLNLT